MKKDKKNINSKKSKPSKQIGILLRILKFVKPFTGLLFLSIFLNSIFSTFTVLCLAIVKPVMQILFDKEISIAATAIPSGNFLENIKNQFFSGVSSIIVSEGSPETTMINLSLLIVFLFILKNIFKYWGAIVAVRLETGIL